MQPISEAPITLFTGKNRFLSNFASFALVFEGVEQPNGYTEPLLHRFRARAKSRD